MAFPADNGPNRVWGLNDLEALGARGGRAIQDQATNWYGRAVNWLTQTSGGKLAQTAGWGFLCGASVVLSALAISTAFSLVSSGVAACGTGAGAPLGVLSIVGGIALGTASIAAMKGSHYCYGRATQCFNEFLALRQQGL